MNIKDFLDTAANLATTVGIFLAVWQLWRTKQQAITSFEDQLAREYRQLARKIPVAALLGQELPEETFEKVREEIYNLKFRTPEMAQNRLKYQLERLNSAENLH